MDSLSIAETVKNAEQHYKKAIERYKNKVYLPPLQKQYEGIVICGMGGSGIAGKIIEHYFPHKNIISITSSHIPEKYQNYGIIAISYSGNTEETLRVVKENESRVIASITSGGKLKKLCKNSLLLPPNFPPRGALPYMLISLLEMLYSLKVLSLEEREKIYSHIKEINFKDTYSKAKEVSTQINEKDIIVFLSDTHNFPAAYRSKTQINENCKMHSYVEVFSEHNHNSILAIKQNIENIFYIFYHSNDANITTRMNFFQNQLIQRKYRFSYVHLSNMLEYIYFGDALSLHLAQKIGVDADNIDIIENLKKYLSSHQQ